MTVASFSAHANEQGGATLFEERQRGKRGTHNDRGLGPRALRALLIFTNDPLSRDCRDDFEISALVGLTRPRQHGFLHVEWHAFFNRQRSNGHAS